MHTIYYLLFLLSINSFYIQYLFSDTLTWANTGNSQTFTTLSSLHPLGCITAKCVLLTQFYRWGNADWIIKWLTQSYTAMPLLVAQLYSPWSHWEFPHWFQWDLDQAQYPSFNPWDFNVSFRPCILFLCHLWRWRRDMVLQSSLTLVGAGHRNPCAECSHCSSIHPSNALCASLVFTSQSAWPFWTS